MAKNSTNKFLTRFLAGVFLILALPNWVFAASVAIPVNRAKRPANDLQYQGKTIDSDQAAELLKNKVDLSQLDPEPNNLWPTDPKRVAISFPEKSEVEYDSSLGAVKVGDLLSVSRMTVIDSQGRNFILWVSPQGHGALVRSALMRKVGYNTSAIKHYPLLKVKLEKNFCGTTKEECRQRFINKLSADTLSDGLRWIPETDRKNTENSEVTLQDVILEPADLTVPQFHWGVAQKSFVGSKRSTRALITLFVLADMPENVNMFGWEMGKVVNNLLVMNQVFANEFTDTDYQDIRWVARKIAKLTRKDFEEIVTAGAYPSDIAALFLEKLISRRNHLIHLAGLGAEFPQMPFETQVNVGKVVNGKATQEFYPGISVRFTFGDVESPIRLGEIAKFMRLEAQGIGLSKVLEAITKKFPAKTIEDITAGRGKDIEEFIQRYIENPEAPGSFPLDTWGGMLAGASIQAGRSVSSGTYYGVDSKIQLVDSLAVQASLGYFLTNTSQENVLPTASANVFYRRDFAHVRALPSLAAVENEPRDDIHVLNFMLGLGDLIKADLKDEEYEKSFDAFAKAMKVGETFIVTDSIGGGAGASAAIPISAILGIPVMLGQEFVARYGVSGNLIMLRKTYITRTADGFHIYLTDAASGAVSHDFGLSFWIDIINFASSPKKAVAKTRAYIIDFKEGDEKPTGKFDSEGYKRNVKIGLALRGLIRGNSPELLESNYLPYRLGHDYSSRSSRFSFLFLKKDTLDEAHTVSLKFRPLDGAPKSEQENVTEEKYDAHLFSVRKVRRSGVNYYSLLSDIVNAAAPGFGPGGVGGNNLTSVAGKAKWSTISTEAEVTDGQSFHPVTISENYWTGWNLKKKDFYKIIDSIERSVSGLNLGHPFMRKEVFNEVTDFQLYEIKSQLVVYPSGLEKIRREFLKAGQRGQEAQVVSRLIEIGGRHAYETQCKNAKVFTLANPAYRSFLASINAEQQYPCLLPWMQRLLEFRNAPPVEKKDIIKIQNQIVDLLQGQLPLYEVLKILGYENYFFQVRVNGFRKNDERMNLEGGQEYFSDSLGTYSTELEQGIFGQFVKKYKILAYELFGRYLGDGF
ncbi:MAG: hypothetical protein AB7F59_04700 [Bdellovibrionales bacterium]